MSRAHHPRFYWDQQAWPDSRPVRAKPGGRRYKKILNLGERDGLRCVACGIDWDLTIDHKVALSKGGTNALDNLQLMCASCNSRKGNA